MKKTFLLAATLFAGASLMAQVTSKPLKKSTELKIVGEGGANGAGVAWHPGQKKYYSAIAGNTTYPMGVYNEKGDRLSTGETTTQFDVRGLWYNSKSKTIQTNGYGEFGWGEYRLNETGIPEEISILQEGMHQPGAQSTGIYDPKDNAIYFFTENGELEKYDFATAEFKQAISLKLGKTKKQTDSERINDDVIDNYNLSAVFTGIKNAEVGLLNISSREIELYSLADGFLTRSLKLPDNIPVYASFNFAYCNNHFWLFDKESRTWMGFKQ